MYIANEQHYNTMKYLMSSLDQSLKRFKNGFTLLSFTLLSIYIIIIPSDCMVCYKIYLKFIRHFLQEWRFLLWLLQDAT